MKIMKKSFEFFMCDNMVFRRERDLTYNRLASMIQTFLSAES